MFVMTALFCALFLGGITTGMLWLDVIITLAFCTVVTLVCMSLLHAITARFRVEQLFKFFLSLIHILQLPRKKRRVMSCPSSVSTAVVLMAPPAQTRSHMPQEMHLSA